MYLQICFIHIVVIHVIHTTYLHIKDGPDALPADEKSLLVSRDPFETLKNLWTFALDKKLWLINDQKG